MPSGTFCFIFILVFIGVAINSCASHAGYSILGMAVSRSNRQRPNSSRAVRIETQPTIYDEYGSIPQVRHCYKAIARASPVVVFRRENVTVVGYGIRRNENGLQIGRGFEPIHTISLPIDRTKVRHHIVLTGQIGDCRTIVKFVKQVALNHTVDFEAAPSAEYLATSLGEFMQSYMSSAGRMLAAQCYIISSRFSSQYDQILKDKEDSQRRSCANIDADTTVTRNTNSEAIITGIAVPMGTLYEVTAVGGVERVVSGVIGGQHLLAAKKILHAVDLSTLNSSASKDLAQRIIHLTSRGNSHEYMEFEDKDENLNLVNLQYIEIPDTLYNEKILCSRKIYTIS